MGSDAPQADTAYAAFISYNHRDVAAARRLLRRLEGYRLPRGLRRDRGTTRLGRIFRDLDELPAASDLSAVVQDALARSNALIVLCSPSAAASPWVDKEIRLFRAQHPDRPLLAALIEGEPAEAFPPALKEGPELLAADLRRGGDGPRLGFLKLVAGLTGVGLDRLVQRDAQRRIRRVTAVTAVSLLLVLALATLSVFAWRARVEAERQRSEAEGLIEFMLTDLRQRLRSVGRLDVLTAANQRAMAYYEDQGDLRRLPEASLERRARVLHAMGEDDVSRGDLARALATFTEAYRTTGVLLDKDRDDPDRIFAHAQSEFWIGQVDQLRGKAEGALGRYRRYLGWAQRLEEIQPDNARSATEMGYALSNIAISQAQGKRDYTGALKTFEQSLSWFEKALALNPESEEARTEIPERHAWIADMHFYLHDYANARKHRERQLALLAQAGARDPKNGDLAYQTLVATRALALINFESGHLADAARQLEDAQRQAMQLRTRDPENQTWFEQQLRVVMDAVEVAQKRDETGDIERLAALGRALLRQAASTGAADPEFRADSLARLDALTRSDANSSN